MLRGAVNAREKRLERIAPTHRRAGARRSADRPGRGAGHLRPRRELPGRARCAARQRHRRARLPPGRRRRDHGRGRRQAHGAPRHLLRHPRARGHQRLGGRPYRAPGFDPDDPVRRPDRPGDAGPGSIPGGRLPADVRRPGQMGGGDRRRGPHPGDPRPGLPGRAPGPAGPGGDRPAGGHARRCRGGGRRPAGRPGRAGAGAWRCGAAACAARRGAAADAAARRRGLDRIGPHGPGRMGGAPRRAGGGVVPARQPVLRRPPEFRRRARDRAEPGPPGPDQGIRPAAHGRRAAVRDAGPILRPPRHPQSRPAAGPCPPGPGGTRKGLPAGAGDPGHPGGVLRGPADL
jgi:hypothetical protein